MCKTGVVILALSILTVGLPSVTTAQGRPDPAVLTASQIEAMQALANMDGEWRGTAWTLLPSGERHEITQTERIGPFLGGAVRVVEGRGYDADGSVSFNALGVISFDPAKKAYNMRSYAMGQAGDFAFTPTDDGYEWEIPAGPMTIRYKAVIEDGTLTEVGDRIMPGKDPTRFFEMTLTRIGDTSWPAAGAVPRQ